MEDFFFGIQSRDGDQDPQLVRVVLAARVDASVETPGLSDRVKLFHQHNHGGWLRAVAPLDIFLLRCPNSVMINTSEVVCRSDRRGELRKDLTISYKEFMKLLIASAYLKDFGYRCSNLLIWFCVVHVISKVHSKTLSIIINQTTILIKSKIKRIRAGFVYFNFYRKYIIKLRLYLNIKLLQIHRYHC
jgi:hypothetical protein